VHILCIALYAYMIIMLVRVFSSYFPAPRSEPMRRLMDLVHAVTEPVLRPLRSLLPPLRMGGMGLDLSPIIVFVVIGILTSYVCR
jgi:YggT family protein